MSYNFNSNENLSFIWNLVYEQDGFTNIPESRIDSIKHLLDSKVKDISEKYGNSNNLIQLKDGIVINYQDHFNLKIVPIGSNNNVINNAIKEYCKYIVFE